MEAFSMLCAMILAFVQQPDPGPPPFGPTEIGVAAEVLGLHFSEQELQLMLPDVSERLREFERLRAPRLANDVAPVLYFLPDPAALRRSTIEDPGVVVTSGPPPRRPDDLEQLAFEPLWTLQEYVRREIVSCLELTRMFLARLKRLDAELHFVVTFTEERALAQARVLDAELAAGKWRGNLHGMPWVAKDLLAVKGYPTTWGTPPFREQQLEHDAAVVERLDAAGAVLLAKVSLGELAWGDVWFGGQTRNPWKPDQGSSGSSAGSASAVAAGCAAFAIGSETYGSIVSPSNACGTSSLRPSFGRVSRFGAMTLCWSLDKLGPICRSAQDASIVFEHLHDFDARDPAMLDLPFDEERRGVRGWKVGVPRGAFDGPGERCRTVLAELERCGVELVEVELPDYPVDEMMIVLAAEAGAAFDEFSRGDGDDQMVRQDRHAWPNVFRHAQLIPAVDYIRANRLRALLIRDYEGVLSTVKAIVHPSFAGQILAATNLSGHPTFVAPCGFSEDGLPFSISFTTRLYGESELMALAIAWQEATDYHRRHPPF
jgi:Asp-tRNA(Asn)/Glu-tRNA(Gln) amidotransferase A subunit family amidase